MGYQQGLSGLQGASNHLNVIGNNIANANTAGFKAAIAQFSDVYANSVSTAVSNGIGAGTRLAEVVQVFRQGSLTQSQNPLDIAISGNGFFQMSHNGATTYTRDGQFHADARGNIVNSAGANLMGYGVNADGSIDTASLRALAAPQGNIPPKATTAIAAQVNLSQTDKTQTHTPFNPADSSTYTLRQPVQAHDSLGNQQNLNLYFVKSATAGAWNVYAGADGAPPANLGTLAFNASGRLTGSTDASGAATASLGKFPLSLTHTTGAATPQAVALDLSGSTQFSTSRSAASNLVADGYATGSLSSYSVGVDGSVSGIYSNGKTMTLGQVVVVNFNNPSGLTSIGSNQYLQTDASGVPQIGVAGTTNHGALKGGATEASTTDLTGELVNLITAQRDYQANAQTIKTQRSVDQTLINL